jgi:hypothetical protein
MYDDKPSGARVGLSTAHCTPFERTLQVQLLERQLQLVCYLHLSRRVGQRLMVRRARHATRASPTPAATTACPAVPAETPALPHSSLPIHRSLATQLNASRLIQPPAARAPSNPAAPVRFATPFVDLALIPTRQTAPRARRLHVFAADSV